MATVPKFNRAQRTALQRRAGVLVASARGASPVTRKAAKSTADALVKKSLQTTKASKPKKVSIKAKAKSRTAKLNAVR